MAEHPTEHSEFLPDNLRKYMFLLMARGIIRREMNRMVLDLAFIHRAAEGFGRDCEAIMSGLRRGEIAPLREFVEDVPMPRDLSLERLEHMLVMDLHVLGEMIEATRVFCEETIPSLMQAYPLGIAASELGLEDLTKPPFALHTPSVRTLSRNAVEWLSEFLQHGTAADLARPIADILIQAMDAHPRLAAMQFTEEEIVPWVAEYIAEQLRSA